MICVTLKALNPFPSTTTINFYHSGTIPSPFRRQQLTLTMMMDVSPYLGDINLTFYITPQTMVGQIREVIIN